MKLVNFENNETHLIITRARDPYMQDLKKAPSVSSYPIVLSIVGGFVMSKKPGLGDPLVCCALGLAVTSPWWLPNIPWQLEGLQRQRIVFDKASRKIYLNENFWAAYKDIMAVEVLTKPGVYLYRRFRLALTRIDGSMLRVVDTPLWADLNMQERYMGEIYLDKQKFKSTDYFKASGLLWRPYEKGMTGYDRNDPWIKDIFDLGALITNEINSSRIQDNLAG